MSHPEDYLARMDEARKEAVRATDPQVKVAWERLAKGWCDLARQNRGLEDARAKPGRKS